jgi:hypothetical protein
VTKVATESIELPDNKRVAGSQCLKAGVEAWSVAFVAARGVAVDVALDDTNDNESIAL